MENLTYSIDQVQTLSGLGRTKLYELINSGQIPAKKLGRKTLILRADLEKFLAGLTSYPTKRETQ